MNLKDYIRSIPDYPKKGILFRDITTLIKNEKAFEEYDELVDIVVEATNGVAPAFYTDPMTCSILESQGCNTKGMTYNDMAELIGGIGFGD